jgi:ABC-2 type transport system ATP-binding protein
MTGVRDETPVIDARGLRKTFGETVALDGIDLTVGAGRIVGLIGPNGAGKTTALNAILGLSSYEGSLRVLGRDPWRERATLMRDVAFIADVAVLPRWITVSQLLDYVAAMHPRFDRARAETFLERTTIRSRAKVKELSKGMIAQLHLAIVMAIDARLLVLDEPTLGLDIIYRKQLFDALLEDYYERERTIILATHNVDEIEHVVTDVIFLDRGRIVLQATMDEVEARYREVRVHPSREGAARELVPIHEREALGQRIMLFDNVDAERLAALGEVRRPSVADLFIARVGNGANGGRQS